ncbi:Cyclic pyranopterin monophosphate synthase [compost metagenome]
MVPSQSIVTRIHKEMPLEPVAPDYLGEVASRYRYVGTNTEIGLISSVTQAFCSSCTRARLSADGRLYTCLFASEGTDLLTPLREGCNDDQLKTLITNVWSRREDHYSEERLHSSREHVNKVEMSYLGG